KVLVPAFALGRAQEVILILKKTMNKKQLHSCPVYVDGMVKDICRMYKLNPNYLRSDLAKKIFRGVDIFYDDNVTPIEKPEFRKEIIESKNPCIIISSSGMLTGGPSQLYAQKLATDENNLIAITGYQDEESPGKDLLKIIETDGDTDEDQDRTIKLGDREINIKCKVGKFGLSAHADKMEIINIANNLYPRRIFLVHGNPEVINSLGKEIQKDINGWIYAPQNGEQYEINIKTPRKQRRVAKYPHMKIVELLNRENIRKLWKFVKTNIGTAAALSVEDLIEIWGYKQDPIEVKEILNDSIYFEHDRRRMFLYHAVGKSEIEKLSAPKVMEVNEMLGLVDEFFGPESGLYKKGARFDEKIALLYFNFPDIAKTRYADEITEFETHTGWQVEINQNINTSAIDEVVYNLFPSNLTINKISYMPQTRKVKISAEDEPVNFNTLSNQFKEITGLSLVINEEDKIEQEVSASMNKSQMEQNQALRYIDKAFSTLTHRPYKKSIKVTSSGVKYIELAFISKIVGEKYVDVINELEQETGYLMTVSDSCNQIEIINIAKRLMTEKDIKTKKNPSVFLDKMSVQVVIAQDIDDLMREEIGKRFLSLTGLSLEII
ncbi:MAG TPA: MBL fold metallo-hydrolase, partial [Thermoanaerobacterales bacterium]|nr:MBL fold metallo-hydrolase [Thermoanaerobacterales bacterium]